MQKKHVLEKLETQRESFLDTLEKIPIEELQLPGVAGEWSIKDILAHLSRWEAELVKLLWQVEMNQIPSSTQIGNVDVDLINHQWQAESRDRSIQRILDDFQSVRNQTILRVEAITERDFENPHRYKWQEGRSLWEWIAADSFEHEAEHQQEIIKWFQDRKK